LSNAFGSVIPGGGSCGTENGSDQSQGFISGIADSFSGVLDGLSSLAGTAAIPFQDLMAQNTKWDDEKNNSVFTARVIYKMGYTGFFQNFGTATIVQRGSIISHPYVLRRTDDNKEYEELLGNPCPPPDGSGGHVVGLWLVPRAIIPISGGGTSAGDAANSALGFLGGLGKCAVSGIGQIAGGLDKFLGSNLGFTMPDGTLKEYPELNMPAKSGVGSTDPSGSSLGRRCGEGGGGAMGSGGCS
jgi:hypothetical protein